MDLQLSIQSLNVISLGSVHFRELIEYIDRVILLRNVEWFSHHQIPFERCGCLDQSGPS